MTPELLAAAVPGLTSATQLATVRGADRYAVLAPDGSTVQVSVDSPDAVGRFRQLATVAGIQASVVELLAAGRHGELGFVVQRPVTPPTLTGPLTPAALAALLNPVAAALGALHDAGMAYGALSIGALATDPGGALLIADLLPVLPIGDRVPPGALPRFAGGLPTAPELADRQPVTAATDVFGFAAVTATLLLGTPDWQRSPAAALRPYGPLADSLLAALALAPADRRATIADLLSALGQSPPKQAWPTPRSRLTAMATAERTRPSTEPADQSLPAPPPVRTRIAVADQPQSVVPPPTQVATPRWQQEIDAAAQAMWGVVPEDAEAVDRPDLRFRDRVEFGVLTAEETRSVWRSPVLICSILATVVVLVVALLLLL